VKNGLQKLERLYSVYDTLAADGWFFCCRAMDTLHDIAGENVTGVLKIWQTIQLHRYISNQIKPKAFNEV